MKPIYRGCIAQLLEGVAPAMPGFPQCGAAEDRRPSVVPKSTTTKRHTLFRCLMMICVVMLAAAAGQSAVRAADSQELITRGLDYLKTRQKEDGSWQSPKEPPGVSALVIRVFLNDKTHNARQPFLHKAIEKLLSYQGPDARISNQMLDNYNTAIAISALAAADGDPYRSQIDKAVAFLKSIQWTDQIEGMENMNRKVQESDPAYGGWGYGRHGRPDSSNLQITIEALHDAGLKPDDPAYQAALKFITRSQNHSETNDQPWAGDDGGFVYTPAGGRPGAPGESPAGEYTSPDGRRRLRSYGSMTYAGLKSMIYAGLTRDDPRVKAAWDWIGRNWTLDENPGMRLDNPDNAQSGLYYYYMTLARSLRAYGQPIITDPQGITHDWRVELIDKLAELQKPDGSWIGEQRWMENNPVLATAYALIALENARRDLQDHPAN